MKKKIYLAYGSNMDLEQMEYRCPTGKLLGISEIPDYRLLFKGSKTGSYATIEPCVGSKVPILVWEIEEQDEINLDYYEGYPRFYQKQYLEVTLLEKTVTGMVYIMDPSRNLGMPSLYYYGVLERAYELFGFEKSILKKALEDSMPSECQKAKTAIRKTA